MIQGISSWLLKVYKCKAALDYEDEIFLYGIEVITTTLLNILLLLFVGIISGTVNLAIVYFMSYALLRKFIGGYHCDTNFKCITFNITKYIIFVCLYPHIEITNTIMILTITITLLLIILRAPFEHKNRSIEKSDRVVYKKYSFMITLVYSVFILLSSTYSEVLSYVLIVIDISSLPCIIESYGKNLKNV